MSGPRVEGRCRGSRLSSRSRVEVTRGQGSRWRLEGERRGRSSWLRLAVGARGPGSMMKPDPLNGIALV